MYCITGINKCNRIYIIFTDEELRLVTDPVVKSFEQRILHAQPPAQPPPHEYFSFPKVQFHAKRDQTQGDANRVEDVGAVEAGLAQRAQAHLWVLNLHQGAEGKMFGSPMPENIFVH